MGYIEFSTPNMPRPSPSLPGLNKGAVVPQIKWFTMKSLFSDNSRVFQKPHTNYGGAVGTVSNSRRKSKYT